MSRPQNLRQIVWCVCLLLLLSSCQDTGPATPRIAWTSSGTRITLNDVEGQILFKVRQRRKTFRVYDDTMRFVGRVRLKEDVIAIEPFPEGEVVNTVQTGVVVEAAGYFRLEQMAVGWTVFDGKSRLVGYIASEDERWSFREQWGGEPTLFAEPSSKGAKIVQGATVIATSDRMSPVMGLVASLKGLTPMARASLGLWLETFGANRVLIEEPAVDMGSDSQTVEEFAPTPTIESAE